MMEDPAPQSLRKRNALLAIAVGGLSAGTLDLTQSCTLIWMGDSGLDCWGRRTGFLKQRCLVHGLFFSAAVEEVSNLSVLPLSALHARGPYQLHDLILGLLEHMIVFGRPISFSVRRFAKYTCGRFQRFDMSGSYGFLGFCGGDDGTRTRDLCRDRAAF
jgi:hypothetical protein